MAKKFKGAKAAKVALPRPTTSLYTSPSVALYFGPTRQIYYVPEVLLQRLENIPSRDPWKYPGEIHLVDVDASIGHVLIHFLHTGVYQTLNDENFEDVDNSTTRNEFQKALLALEAAKKYRVPGLQELAQIELERQGKDMCLRDAVRAIREDFIAGPPDEHAWLRDYVSKKVRWTFEHDPTTLYAPDFFESIESPTLTKLLAQLIVGLYSEKVASLHKGKTATSKISTPERTEPPGSSWSDLPKLPSRRIAEISNAWPASVEKFGAFDDSVAAWDPHNLGQDPGNRPEASALAALSSCNKEDKMELEKWMKEEAAAEDRGNAEARIQKEELAEIRQLEAEKGTIAQLQEQDVTAASSAASKDEADKLEVKSIWDSWGGAPVFPGKKKKKGKKGSTTEPPPPPPPMRSSPPSSPHNIQLKIDLTPVIDDDAAVAAIVPAAQEDPGVEIDPYAGLSKSQAKKLKAKLDKEARLEDEEDTKRQREKEEAAEIRRQEEEEMERICLEEEERLRLEAEEAELKRTEEEEAAAAAAAEAEESKKKEDDIWGGWGGAAPTVKKKKKKKDKKVEPIRLEEEEAERNRLAQEEEAAAATAAEARVSAFDSSIETGATSDDDDCKLRLEHLSRIDGWQNCKPCELYMRKIAMKLHSVGLPNVNGSSTID